MFDDPSSLQRCIVLVSFRTQRLLFIRGREEKRKGERKKKKRKEKEEREIEGERKKLEDASRITAVALLISVILYPPVFIIGLNDTE